MPRIHADYAVRVQLSLQEQKAVAFFLREESSHHQEQSVEIRCIRQIRVPPLNLDARLQPFEPGCEASGL